MAITPQTPLMGLLLFNFSADPLRVDDCGISPYHIAVRQKKAPWVRLIRYFLAYRFFLNRGGI
jgi:hypothetical protein